MDSGASFVELMFRLVISMGVVLGLMWVLAKVMRNRTGMLKPVRGKRDKAQIEIIARQQLGRNTGLAVVRMGSKVFALGMTEQSVTQLGELESLDFAIDLDEELKSITETSSTTGPSANTWTAETGSSSSGSPWKNALDAMRERTLRK